MASADEEQFYREEPELLLPAYGCVMPSEADLVAAEQVGVACGESSDCEYDIYVVLTPEKHAVASHLERQRSLQATPPPGSAHAVT